MSIFMYMEKIFVICHFFFLLLNFTVIDTEEKVRCVHQIYGLSTDTSMNNVKVQADIFPDFGKSSLY